MSVNFKNRIHKAEIDPPDKVWPRILQQLNEASNQTLPERIIKTYVEPPVNTWNNILATLEGESGGRVISINRKRRNLAIAAAAVGIILVSAFYFLRSDPAANSMAGNEQLPTIVDTQQKVPESPLKEIADSDPGPITQGSGTNLIPVPPRKRSVLAGLARGANNQQKLRYAAIESSGTPEIEKNIPSGEVLTGDLVSASSNFIPAPDYYNISAPNGQPARISSKFAGAVNSLFNSPDDSPENISWKKRFESWRSKLMNNPGFIPSATNFLDIVELKELLKEQ